MNQNKQTILGLIRHLLTAAGGALVAHGYTDSAEAEQLTGALITLIGVVWSIIQKRNAAKPANPSIALCFLLSAFCFSLLTACQTTLAPGADPAVVYAEQSAKLAHNVFDEFLRWEERHEAAVLAIDPKIHNYAEDIRENGLRWIEELVDATQAYKASRSGTDLDKLRVTQAFLDMALNETQIWFARAKRKS